VVPAISRKPIVFICKDEKEKLLAYQMWKNSQPTAQLHILEELNLQTFCREEFENRTKQKKKTFPI